MTSGGIPEDVWARWSRQEYEVARQAVLAFGGSVRTEALIDSFQDVSIVTDSNSANPVKGVVYLTSKRIMLLPRNNLVHENVCQAEYDSLRTLSGSRSDLSISLIDANGAVATFHFPTQQVLFQCFNLLRKLAEASRLDETMFVEAMSAIVSAKTRDEKAFSSIEVELQECKQTVEITAESVVPEATVDPIVEELKPIRDFYDFVNSVHFHIHLKLRILFVLSFVSFALKFMPFLPFCALCTIGFLLFTAWRSINRDLDAEEEDEHEVSPEAEGFVRARKFVQEWFFWEKPRNGMMLIEGAGAVLVAWIILPEKAYRLSCVIALFVVVLRPVVTGDALHRIIPSTWLSN